MRDVRKGPLMTNGERTKLVGVVDLSFGEDITPT